MDQKGHMIDQTNKQIEVLDLKHLLFLAELSIAELGGTPLPPLRENHSAQKPLAERGGGTRKKIC